MTVMVPLPPAKTPSLKLQTLRDAARLDALGPAWDALSRRSGARPFLDHGYLAAWLATVGRGRRPWLRLAWRDARLVGVLPLMQADPRQGQPPRALVPLAEGRLGIAGWLLDPSEDVAALLGALMRPPRGRYLRLEPLEAADAALAAEAAARAGLGVRTRATITALAADLPPEGFDAFLAGLGRNTRRNHRRAERALGPLSWTDTATDPEAALAAWLAVARTSWKGQARSGIAATDPGRAFLARLARNLPPDRLEIAAATSGGVPAYCTMGPVVGDTLYVLAEEFNETFAKEGAGRYGGIDTIRRAAERGLTRVDMMRDTPVNRAMTNHERRLWRALVWRPFDPTWRLYRAEGLARRLRRAQGGAASPRAAALEQGDRR